MDQMDETSELSSTIPEPVSSQNLYLTEQLASYWAESQSLRSHIEMLQTQLAEACELNISICHELSAERIHHSTVAKELSLLREQFQQLKVMVSAREGSEKTPPRIFRLEAREIALQQMELDLSQKAAALRLTCQNIESWYCPMWEKRLNHPRPVRHASCAGDRGCAAPANGQERIGAPPGIVDVGFRG
ncbi:uncharacterized protein KD926_002077 [Aspergillus affinis]|uniref:uncharacterized protein n=1 Tax=Aspergillus affinis TaxID=1070780 RepID=UPI0022FE4615|nr:uncharacterized protein KD926_002077 [Aspergillus affinis]KAI9036314.1 hypothetical protein KD926_002077 [Aspergillus affinis]